MMTKSPKYPIVLVHGMMVRDFKIYRAFRKIRNYISKFDVKVYVTNQDGVGSIENNAAQLKDEILKILEKEKVEKVNLIAHSKGGLDSRYMISMLDMDDHVASLTTLSTPHHGSKMSARIMKLPKFIASFIAFFINLVFRVFGDKHPDILTVGKQLSDDYMKGFNEEIVNSNKVYYQSYSSDIDKKATFLVFIPHAFSKRCEEENTDGVVSISSSVWGDYQGHIDVEADHFQMAGIYGGKKKIQEVSAFYLSIVKELKEKGF